MSTPADTAPDVVAALDATDPNAAGGTDVDAPPAAPDAGDSPDAGQDADATVEGEDALGDPGKQALDRMKERWRNERTARIAAEARLNDLSPADDPERIRREAEAQAMSKANARIVGAEIRAAAAGRLANPAAALKFIDLEQFDVDEDGSVDQDEIAQAIDDLLAAEPYLAAQGGTKPPKADPSQGAGDRGTASTADQFAQAIGNLI